MHSRDDARVPFDQGGQLAAGIARARFVPLPSPAFPKFLQEIRASRYLVRQFASHARHVRPRTDEWKSTSMTVHIVHRVAAVIE